jgi:hypothetical protein
MIRVTPSAQCLSVASGRASYRLLLVRCVIELADRCGHESAVEPDSIVRRPGLRVLRRGAPDSAIRSAPSGRPPLSGRAKQHCTLCRPLALQYLWRLVSAVLTTRQ